MDDDKIENYLRNNRKDLEESNSIYEHFFRLEGWENKDKAIDINQILRRRTNPEVERQIIFYDLMRTVANLADGAAAMAPMSEGQEMYLEKAFEKIRIAGHILRHSRASKKYDEMAGTYQEAGRMLGNLAENPIQYVQGHLEEAVAEEKFEEAAILRDMINRAEKVVEGR